MGSGFHVLRAIGLNEREFQGRQVLVLGLRQGVDPAVEDLIELVQKILFALAKRVSHVRPRYAVRWHDAMRGEPDDASAEVGR